MKTDLISNESKNEDSTGKRRVIFYIAWGDYFVKDAIRSALSAAFMNIPIVLVTNAESKVFIPEENPFHEIKFIEGMKFENLLIKSSIWRFLPEDFDSFLFVDTDTTFIKDVTFGFEKAEQYGIALSPATNYNLRDHGDFGRVMREYDMPDVGRMQYNTGVIFFAHRLGVKEVFELWEKLTVEITEKLNTRKTDQPYFSFVMELLDFNPYALTINYNFRGHGELTHGDVRLWHSHFPVPENINVYHRNPRKRGRYPWRRYYKGKLVKESRALHQQVSVNKASGWRKFIRKAMRKFRRFFKR